MSNRIVIENLFLRIAVKIYYRGFSLKHFDLLASFLPSWYTKTKFFAGKIKNTNIYRQISFSWPTWRKFKILREEADLEGGEVSESMFYFQVLYLLENHSWGFATIFCLFILNYFFILLM